MASLMRKGGLGVAKPASGRKAPSARGAARKPAKDAGPPPPVKAMSLLGRWTRMAQGHIAFGGGCNCCGEFGNLQVKDMEQHILDYLDTKYRSAKVEGVSALLAESAGYRPNEAGSIADLLRAIASRSDLPLPPDTQTALLADLERSIDSLDEMLKGTGIT